jgi:NAD(P) transhydrogenase subunit beta
MTAVAYIAATILFILSLGGLSNPETSRRGNLYGMLGMAIAVIATIVGRIVPAGIAWTLGALAVGAAIGIFLARTVKMTQMPELVAFMHSLVGLVAMLVGYASYIDPTGLGGHDGRGGDDPSPRDLSRRADRRRDALRLRDCVRQALGKHRRQARAAAWPGIG